MLGTIEAELNLNRQKSESLTGGRTLIYSLVYNGVDLIFGFPGGAIMPVYDELIQVQRDLGIRHILVRHEQGAVHAAEGYAKLKKRPGVVFATSGPGALNTITGLNNALMDSTPLVVITGQVARPLIGTQAFQEAPVVEVARPVTKWAYRVQNASEIPSVINHAFKVAQNGRPGPALVDIPKDVQFEKAYEFSSNGFHQPESPTLTSDTLMKLKHTANLLDEAKRPYILAGQGVLISQATSELRALAEKAGIPVANTLLGLSSFPQDSELFAGMLGMHGRYAANMLTNEADVILAVGMRFDDRVTGRVKDYAPQANIVHIDIDPTQLNRIVSADIPINAGAKLALDTLMQIVNVNQHPEWIERFRKFDKEEAIEVSDKALARTGSIKMAQVVDLISQKTRGDAVVIADVGQHQMIAAQYYKPKYPDSFFTSGGMGTMGFALPAAIGAKVAAPEREVIAIIGDGSVQMTVQELGTVMQEQLPIKTVILNNQYLGMVRQWQDLFHGGRHSFVDLSNPDFVTLARAYGIKAEVVKNPRKLNGALDRMLNSKDSYILDIHVEKEDNVFPMIPSGAAVNEVRLK